MSRKQIKEARLSSQTLTGWRWSRHLNFLAQSCGDATPLLKITEFRMFQTSQAAIVNNSILNDQSTVDGTSNIDQPVLPKCIFCFFR
jgi:steroid 5-alpha reductase family enzyme